MHHKPSGPDHAKGLGDSALRVSCYVFEYLIRDYGIETTVVERQVEQITLRVGGVLHLGRSVTQQLRQAHGPTDGQYPMLRSGKAGELCEPLVHGESSDVRPLGETDRRETIHESCQDRETTQESDVRSIDHSAGPAHRQTQATMCTPRFAIRSVRSVRTNLARSTLFPLLQTPGESSDTTGMAWISSKIP